MKNALLVVGISISFLCNSALAMKKKQWNEHKACCMKTLKDKQLLGVYYRLVGSKQDRTKTRTRTWKQNIKIAAQQPNDFKEKELKTNYSEEIDTVSSHSEDYDSNYGDNCCDNSLPACDENNSDISGQSESESDVENVPNEYHPYECVCIACASDEEESDYGSCEERADIYLETVQKRKEENNQKRELRIQIQKEKKLRDQAKICEALSSLNHQTETTN